MEVSPAHINLHNVETNNQYVAMVKVRNTSKKSARFRITIDDTQEPTLPQLSVTHQSLLSIAPLNTFNFQVAFYATQGQALPKKIERHVVIKSSEGYNARVPITIMKA